MIVDLDDGQAKAAAADLGEGHLGFACDVTDRQSCQDAAERVIGEFGRVDVLVNNAGITQPLKIMDIDAENYDAVLDVNLRGTLYMSQAVIPQMREQRSGSIVCMSSVSAQRGGGIFGGPHYCAAKARRARPGQGHGAGARPGQRPRQLDHARPDPDRHHRRQADRRAQGRRSPRASRSAASASPTTWPTPACSSPPTCRPTSPAP